MRVLAIDQGTTNTKALVVDEQGQIVARAAVGITSAYPSPGWAEQSASTIWNSTRQVIDTVAEAVGADSIGAIAISNQRETLVTWDAESGEPVGPAILWQCRRTATECAALIAAGHGKTVEAATGLGINPLFPAAKLAWVLRNNAKAAELERVGRLRAGTVDSWLLWNLTAGASFATDHSNASRTQLFDTDKLEWSEELCGIFGAPIGCLPNAMASGSRFGATSETATRLGSGIPIHAMMGDSHAALYGHGVRLPGVVKSTYGTGSSLMTLTQGKRHSQHGLSSTVAWTDANGTAYALEGNITVSAQAAAFMASLLGARDARALSDLAQTVNDSLGVAFVPALAGLGAPHWNDAATGTISGMTHGTQPAHLARATFEAIAMQIVDVFEAMQNDVGKPLKEFRADGGASANDFLMQLQADLLDLPVERSMVEEIGALGAAEMAFCALGVPVKVDDDCHRFQPSMDTEKRNFMHARWKSAVAQANWRF